MKLDCLIVDDNPLFRLMLKELVKRDNPHLNLVGTAKSAAEARAIFGRHPIDIIFLDLGLPDMDGFEFIESIGNPGDVQIILVTAYEERATEAFKYGVTDYLVKPVTRERFNSAVSKAIKQTGKDLKTTESQHNLFQKVADYMISRGLKALEPVPERAAKVGYAYPVLTANFGFGEEEKALDFLNEAEREGFLTSKFMDAIYVCDICSNSMLHFREICPNCGSSETKDPAGYEKSASAYLCKQCQHRFDTPEIKAKCHHCGANARVEHLEKKEIKSYKLTEAGKQAAAERVDIDLTTSGKRDEPAENFSLRQFFEKGIHHKKTSGKESCVAKMQFKNIADLYRQLNIKPADELMRKFRQITTGELLATDEAEVSPDLTVHLLLRGRDFTQSKKLLNDIAARLSSLIQNNFNGFDPNFFISLQEISTDESLAEQLNTFGRPAVEKKSG